MIIFYKVTVTLLYPFLLILVFYRKLIKKEDPIRYKEKIFSNHFNFSKKKGAKLYWFHAASIGEFKSIIPIIRQLNLTKGNFEFLITTNTLSSSNLANNELKKLRNVTHRFFPLDVGFLIIKFLKTYKPDFIFLVDSEIWPNLITEAKNQNISIAIINARITTRSFKRWSYFPLTSKKIFSKFDFILASNKETKNYLEILGAKNIYFNGNIKFISQFDSELEKKQNTQFLSDKRFWLAASTHEGEEVFCIDVHKNLRKFYKDIITIVAPRHIHRVKSIENICKQNNLNYQVLNKNDLVKNNKEFIIINSFGVLNDFYFHAKSVFIGKSYLEKIKHTSGQSPMDAANLGCKIYHGPYVYNFEEIYRVLKEKNISVEVKSSKELSHHLLNDLKYIKKDNNFGIIIEDIGKKILKDTMRILNNYLFYESN